MGVHSESVISCMSLFLALHCMEVIWSWVLGCEVHMGLASHVVEDEY